MVAEEVFVNFCNFNPIRIKHGSIHVKKYGYSSQKCNFKAIKLSGAILMKLY
jgi:hypothetical protein